MERFIWLFIVFASLCSLAAICYVIMEILLEGRRKASKKSERSCKQRRDPCGKSPCLWGVLWVGLGAISLVGHVFIAHRVNKIYGNLEERRRGK